MEVASRTESLMARHRTAVTTALDRSDAVARASTSRRHHGDSSPCVAGRINEPSVSPGAGGAPGDV